MRRSQTELSNDQGHLWRASLASPEGNGADCVKLLAGAEPFGTTLRAVPSLVCEDHARDVWQFREYPRSRSRDTTERRIHKVEVNG
jgi:hypothetical protein